ncbi:hypothetical protein [Silicimonas sp. MF1-12-2]|uniref:DUF7946 domain-containing protein n=1 Tax=Silicimonas sp. MF1-12-2 TaxID=3384793 RepID=UPI0039B69032
MIIEYTGNPFPITLRYKGELADEGLIDLYDLSRAIRGYERSLSLVTHFALNNEIITQSTSLRGAQILCAPPDFGSYKFPALITSMSVGAFALGSLEPNNPLGHVIFSLYDFVVHEATGQKVDYEESLRETYERALQDGSEGFLMPKKSQLESLVEKVEPAIADMHRPIVGSETAELAIVGKGVDATKSDVQINLDTFQGLRYRTRVDDVISIGGRVSMFNMNTFNGRFVPTTHPRPIPFYLTAAGRTSEGVNLIAESLQKNIANSDDPSCVIRFDVMRDVTRTGRVAKLIVVGVGDLRDDEEDLEVIDESDND